MSEDYRVATQDELARADEKARAAVQATVARYGEPGARRITVTPENCTRPEIVTILGIYLADECSMSATNQAFAYSMSERAADDARGRKFKMTPRQERWWRDILSEHGFL